jgi:hypothetical protein
MLGTLLVCKGSGGGPHSVASILLDALHAARSRCWWLPLPVTPSVTADVANQFRPIPRRTLLFILLASLLLSDDDISARKRVQQCVQHIEQMASSTPTPDITIRSHLFKINSA